MDRRQYVWLAVLSGVAVAMALTIVALSAVNEKLQRDLGSRQTALQNSILGPQGQQVSAAILRDLATAAVGNAKIRQLLERHAYAIPADPRAAAPEKAKGAAAAPKAADAGGSEDPRKAPQT